MREAWEALPLTRAEQQARKQRYKDKRWISKPLYGYEFAARMGVNEGTVKRWEKSGVVGDEHAPAVSKALGIPIGEITQPRRQKDLAALESRLEEVEAQAVTTEELRYTAALLRAGLDKVEAAIRSLANGKTQEALRVLSDEGTP